MQTYDMGEAKTSLPQLIDKAVDTGKPFVIAKAGKPLVRVVRSTCRSPFHEAGSAS